MKNFIEALIGKGYLPSLTLEDMNEINIPELFQRVKDQINNMNPDALKAFEELIVVGKPRETVIRETGLKNITQTCHYIKKKLNKIWWKTEYIRKRESVNEQTEMRRLWLPPELTQWLIDNHCLYKTVCEMTNYIAIEKLKRNRMKDCELRSLDKVLQLIYPIKFNKYPWNFIWETFKHRGDFFRDYNINVISNSDDIKEWIDEVIKNEEDISFIKEVYDEGKTRKEISARTGKSLQTISLRLKKLSYKLLGNPRTEGVIAKHSFDQIVRLYGMLAVEKFIPGKSMAESLPIIQYIIKSYHTHNHPYYTLNHSYYRLEGKSDEEIYDRIIGKRNLCVLLKADLFDLDKFFPKETDEDMSILDLDLSVRAYNVLKRKGCENVGDILNLSKEELMRVRNMGEKTYKEIINKLESLGFDVEKLK